MSALTSVTAFLYFGVRMALRAPAAIEGPAISLSPAILPLYAERFHASPSTIGLLVASFSVAQLALSPVWGRLSDRVGRKPVLLVSLVGTCVGGLLTGLAGSLAGGYARGQVGPRIISTWTPSALQEIFDSTPYVVTAPETSCRPKHMPVSDSRAAMNVSE